MAKLQGLVPWSQAACHSRGMTSRAPLEEARALLRAHRAEEAVRLLRRLAALAPDAPAIASLLGVALLQGQDSRPALAHFQAVTRRWPRVEEGWQGLGKALVDLYRPDEAVAAFTEAAGCSETPARALYHRGMAHLLAGRFAEGWADYEHRLQVPELRPRLLPAPLWDGAPLAGRRLLVVCEQGYGDVFQAIRFLPRLRALGGTVVFECPAELRALLAPVLAGCEVVPLRGLGPPDARFDAWLPLLSLPHRLGIALADLPGPMPYLQADPVAMPAGAIGVCWAGNPRHPQDHQRSMDPEHLAPLARLPGVRLVSLQKDQAHRPPLPGFAKLLHPPPLPLADFAATARVIAGLDAVVTVDTAIAHLAGALGKPAFLLLHHAAEWRWLVGRADSPWYPALRLARQPEPGDWQGAVSQVLDDYQATRAPAAAPTPSCPPRSA